jgi:hypothetical protein
MSKIIDKSPEYAFPFLHPNGFSGTVNKGMTIREYYAGQFLAAKISTGAKTICNRDYESAIERADNLIEFLKDKGE